MVGNETRARRAMGVLGLTLFMALSAACSSPDVTPTAVVEAASSATPTTTSTPAATSTTTAAPTTSATPQPVAAARVATTTARATKVQPKIDDKPNQLVAAPRRVTTTARPTPRSAPTKSTPTETAPTKSAPAKSSDSGGSSVGTVHPGSFCSHAGAEGITNKGTGMVCRPGSDGKLRWGKA